MLRVAGEVRPPRASLPSDGVLGDEMTTSVLITPASKDTISGPVPNNIPLLKWLWDGFWNFLYSAWDFCVTAPHLRKAKATMVAIGKKTDPEPSEILQAAKTALDYPNEQEIQNRFTEIKGKIKPIVYQKWNVDHKPEFNVVSAEVQDFITLLKNYINWKSEDG
ncbi:MAG: hypothetical protein H7A40_01920 [Chlamydiales bacterium]|nr:hypothetical protein [Chlamydiales bacterium]